MFRCKLVLAGTTALASIASFGAVALAQAPVTTAPPANTTSSQAPTTTTAPEKLQKPVDKSAVDEVVVTGSRIRKPAEFTSPDPIQVISAEDATLRGFTDTATIIQGSTIAANSSQVNNYYTGYVVNGGPGVNTVSLRGLGTDRTLVLLDGERMGPAGVSGTVGAVDLNTIPSTIIDHIDILKDGASSIYGSDAVAGVVNIITKSNLDGGEANAYAKPSNGGDEYDASIAYGKVWERGYANVSADFYDRVALEDGQRSYLNCGSDEATDPSTGLSLDLATPGTSQPRCLNILSHLIIDGNTGLRYIPLGNQASGVPTNFNLPGLGLANVICTVVNTPQGPMCSNAASPTNINTALTYLTHAEEPDSDPLTQRDTAISPVKRYSFTGKFGYDIVPQYVEVYDTFLFSQRISTQNNTRQVFPYVDPANPSNVLSPLGDYLEPIVLTPFDTQQRVNYIRDLVGVKGALPNVFTTQHLHYNLSAQYSQSDGTYATDYVNYARLNATTGPTACNPSFGSGGSSINGGPSMTDLGDTATCVPINWTADSFSGRFSPAEEAFLTGTDVGHTIYDQAYVQGDVTADLYQLPAGPLGADVGFHVRREFIHDTPGPATLEGNSWGLSSAGITQGSQFVKEAYAEFSIPAIKNFPAIKALSFDISGRYSDYNTVGDAETYKASMVWEMTDWLTLKYVQGTSFRAPQLYELYLANQTSYYGQFGLDPCINYGAGGVAPNIVKNCAAQGIPSNYAGFGSSALVTSGGGAGELKPETSFSKTISIVFTPHWFNLNAGVEVDYYENTITRGIQQFGPSNILYSCYNSNNFPNNGFCNLFTRDLNPSSPSYLNILSVQNNYVNVATVIDRGLDATLFYTQKLPFDVRFRLDSQLSWTFQNSTQLTGTSVPIDYTGSVTDPVFVGNTNLKFTWHTWTANWFFEFVGKTSDARLTSDTIQNFYGTGQTAKILIDTPFYTVQNVSVQKLFKGDLRMTVGIQNIWNQPPPAYSADGVEAIIGQSVLGSQYDLIGRTAFFQVDKKF